MSELNQEQIIVKMGQGGLIPVFNHTDYDIARQVLDACYQGGIRVFEFTNRGDNALEVFGKLVAHAEQYPDLLLGIGTIFSAEDAQKFHQVGAQFIVSPAMIPDLAEFCKGQNILWIPGCGTVSEIYQATQLGAKVIKAFPGNVLGPGFVKSVKAVFPNVPIMPTGGVAPTKENLKTWFDAGVTCVGMGSKLITKSILQERDFDGLRHLVANALATIEEVKPN
ncbi:bifunctional 4-hydroxy-2-oxoglutarate aldolase/2-dehydro-3-deoxy-phosphogluconate aldolase [Croceivirga thetidis]|uniref:Bifunctional 4-hydroxy-2-oxoglutarate aldolase/2-dehydro-3-deoxy-phosphogluconate aldolase n=1 Tax=Croceivirga thetidis TaxID=2721623 RepID=A0ABX1GPA0_9FLAO|nr:bifunctional 4-hydroxy-2-oxoglutarate aldolase/2-dehydro-3-deoxy-phosphogluconate aldolase [Croceivirga thetidis]NKI31756.1 bifunctional 4-hydroxy-2-oxoglutarate aldolase/2-dehydro-3-deoxy-phosphogluconate aldolase [Croceivirga thetidis]